MQEKTLLRVGIIGAIIAAICCFTPALVILMGVMGLSSVVGMLDIVLLPALAVFLTITRYAFWKRPRQSWHNRVSNFNR
jgi:mercuric ion transport protein